jgi:outer membrane protein assembly factor BamB
MIRRPHAIGAAIVASVAALLGGVPTAGHAWERRIQQAWASYLLATDANGDVFTALTQKVHRSHELTVAVAKLSHERGRELWRRSLKVPGPEHSDTLAGLVATADGDVIAAGVIEIDGRIEFVVTRLSGGTGRPLWQRVVRGTERPQAGGGARSIVLDAAGDVVVAGWVESETYVQYHGTQDLAVVKLDASDGRERWRFVLDGTAHTYDVANHVAVDGAGDVLVVGEVFDDVSSPFALPSITAFKLAGGTGVPLWRRSVPELVDVRALARAGDGDLVLAGTALFQDFSHDFGIVTLSGADGTMRWMASIGRSEDVWESALGVVVLPSGAVVGAGFVGDFDHEASFLVAAFDGTTGAERWRRALEGSDAFGRAFAIAATPAGNVVAGGQFRNTGSCYDIALVELAGTTGDVLSTRSFDGTTTARLCDSTCEYRCRFTQDGIDQDTLYGLTVDGQGRAVVAGTLDDGPRGKDRAFLSQFATSP